MNEPKHRWLVAGNVITASPKGAHQRALNVMVNTVGPAFSRNDLATAQDGLMRRFTTETEQQKGAKIVDVFILSVSHLGLQTQEEFDGSFAASKPADDGQLSMELN